MLKNSPVRARILYRTLRPSGLVWAFDRLTDSRLLHSRAISISFRFQHWSEDKSVGHCGRDYFSGMLATLSRILSSCGPSMVAGLLASYPGSE